MIQLIAGLVLGEWTTSVLSFLAFILSIFSLIGCDLIRLNFGAINDFGIFFQQPSWFGIGLINHQNFDENKSSIIWEHNATCYNYDDVGIEMLRSSNLPISLQLTALGCILSIIVFFAVVVMLCKKQSCLPVRVCSIVASLTSALLQIAALVHAFSSTGGGVCDPSTYSNWYDSFPPFDYPKERYMKFFSGCSIGATAQILGASIVFQLLTLVWMSVNFAQAKKKAQEQFVEEDGEKKVFPRSTKEEQQMAFIDDGLAVEPEITHPALAPQKEQVDIEEGVPASPSGDCSEMTEEVEVPDEEIVPLTGADATEDEVEAVEEAVEEVVESDDVKEAGEPKDDVEPKDDEEPKDDGAEQQQLTEEEELYSLHTTDVRKEAEATVGNVKIASMKSGRF